MASAEEYAGWIVKNQDKQGTPEFETVAQAYKVARSQFEQPAAIEATPSTKDRLVSAGLKGLGSGGVIPAMVNMAGTGLDVANEALTKGSYEAGGKVSEIGAKLGLPAEVAAGAGFATNVGLQAIPALIGGKGAATVAPILESGAKNLMQSALKPTLKDLKTGKAASAIQTMLDEGINVTSGGIEKLKDKIGVLNTQIFNAVSASTATIDKGAVWKSVKETLDRFTKQVNPNADIAKIRGAWDEFLSHPLISGETIPVPLAQELKQGTYRVLSKKYGEMGSAETEAQKALARGLKEEIATAVPAIRPLNAEESKLINALNVVERRVLISANKNPGGLAWLTHNPASWAAFMADKSELFKSLVARMVYSGSERVPQGIAGTGIAAGQSLTQQPQP